MKALIWYRPLLKATASPLVAFSLVIYYHRRHYGLYFDVWEWLFWVWFGQGVLYTHIFEYLYHRFVLHEGIPSLEWFKESHRMHHLVFHPQNYKTRNPDDMEEVAVRWFVFPILLFVHYFFFLNFLPPRWIAFAPIFFLGVLLRFLAYETTHYFSHLADNFFDRWIKQIPLLRIFRTRQDKHHWRHHTREETNFGFVGFLLDWLFRTLFPPFKLWRWRNH